MQLFTIAAMLIAASAVAFALQNSVQVMVTFLLWQFDSSLAFVLLLALAAGGFVVALVSTPSTLRKQWTVIRQNKRIAELEKTCSTQERDIIGLMNRLPAGESAPVTEETPYVGLTQIFAGTGHSGKAGSAPSE